jgi:PAS domain S-box-containing protein
MNIGSSFERAQILWGPALTAAIIAAIEAARLVDITIPNPQLFTAVAIAFAAYSGGYRGGLMSAAIGVAYAFYFFATPEAYFSYTDSNSKKIIVNIITLPSIAILVSELNRKYKDSINNEVNAFFVNANAPVLALDGRGCVIIWNRYLENMTGYRREDILGQPIHAHEVFGGNGADPQAFWSLGVDRWHSEILEIPLRCKEGRSIDLLASATPRRDRSGAYDGVVCIGQDITERKNAERRLAETMQRYQSLVDMSPDGVVVTCGDRIVFCNQAMAAMLGANDPKQIVGRPLMEFNTPADWEVILQRREAVRRGEKVELRETILYRLDGSPIHAERTVAGINWEGEEAFLVLTRDITKRRNAERQVRQIVDSLQDGFVLYDAADRLVLWNDKWFELHKMSADIIGIGTRFEDLIRTNVARGLYPEAAGCEEAFVQGCIGRHREPGEPIVHRFAGGRWIIVREARTANGGTFTVNIDVTDIKNAERAAQEARLRAETADNSKSEFLANMSHELRTPLNAIIGFASVMEAESFGSLGSEKYNKYTQYIGQSGRHLLALISDILDLSKVEAGAEELHEEDIDVRMVSESVVRLVSDRAVKEGVRIALQAPAELPALRADARKLNQVLFNLLTNAIKFTREGGQVALALSCGPEGGHVFEVSDTGIGIAPENLPKVLSKFGQVDSSLTRRHEGTGLGLPLTKALVELHGGTFEIESEVDVGTTVTVRFPVGRIVTKSAPQLRQPAL